MSQLLKSCIYRPRYLPVCFARYLIIMIVCSQELLKGDTCGFCGGKSCRTSLHVPTKSRLKTPIILSNCWYAPKKDVQSATVDLALSTAKKSVKSSPCTNMPMKCRFCEQVTYVWKYGMFDHVHREHDSQSARLLRERNCDAMKFQDDYTVSQEEKDAVKAWHESAISKGAKRKKKEARNIVVEPQQVSRRTSCRVEASAGQLPATSSVSGDRGKRRGGAGVEEEKRGGQEKENNCDEKDKNDSSVSSDEQSSLFSSDEEKGEADKEEGDEVEEDEVEEEDDDDEEEELSRGSTGITGVVPDYISSRGRRRQPKRHFSELE